MIRTLPQRGRKSPKFGHLGMWNLSLGPNSPIPGSRLEICILDQTGRIIRRFEQIRGECTDTGYVDFFLGRDCHPASHQYPIVDIDGNGKVTEILCKHYRQEMGMDLYMSLLNDWVITHGKPEYAL